MSRDKRSYRSTQRTRRGAVTTFGSRTDVGCVRDHNEDSLVVAPPLFAVADGMGGHAGGDTASSIAIRSLAHIEQDDTGGNVETISRMMETSVMAAHDAIVGKAKRERKLAGMGTTVTAVALVAGYWVIAHIGDSRAYLLRDGRLSRITCDHSYVQHLINTGRITPPTVGYCARTACAVCWKIPPSKRR